MAVLEPNRASYSTQARDLVERFVTKVGGGTDPWSRRFANNFGLVYAAARLAAEMNIAPWPRDHAFKCVSRLYRRARALVATPEEARDGLLRRLAANASSKRRFPTVKRGRGLPRRVANSAWGIRHHCGGHACLAVLSDRLDNLVRPQRHADQVRRLLASGGFTLIGTCGR